MSSRRADCHTPMARVLGLFLLVGLRAAGALAPPGRDPAAAAAVSRRSTLTTGIGAAVAAVAGVPLRARAAEEDATFVRASYGAGSVEMPSTWLRDGERVREAVLGPITDSIRATAKPTALASIDDLGPVGSVKLAALGLAGSRALGDFVAAKRRVAADGAAYYEYDLAVPPPGGICPRSEQEVIVCPPVEVALVSATVADGALVVFEVGVDKAQWRNFGKQIRTMRSTFHVTAPAAPN